MSLHYYLHLSKTWGDNITALFYNLMYCGTMDELISGSSIYAFDNIYPVDWIITFVLSTE